jgi:hypothetical protein
MPDFAQIAVRRDVDLKTFHEEIVPAAKPVVLRQLVTDWPAVRAARESPRALADAIKGFDRGAIPYVIEQPPELDGRLFYRDDMSGLNFTRQHAGIGATLDRLLALQDQPNPGSIFLESMKTDDYLPDFANAHVNPLLDASVRPRIWIGNRVKVQTHYDLLYNIACVAGGRRRFTLFPPEQVANLYIGPFDFTPSGAPVSMVPLTQPDLARFPRFAEALAHAQQAELEPGDAIYIPYAWWHHVESLTPFNVLVNYWWNDAPKVGSPYAVLLHASLSIRGLPEDQRRVWRTMFEQFAFADPDAAMSHLLPENRGLLGPSTRERTDEIRKILAQTFGTPTR